MIALISGKVGSGKTLFAVYLAVRHLIKGGTVCSNVKFHFDELKRVCRERYKVELVPDQLRYVDLKNNPEWHKLIPWGVPSLPVLCLWDEVHLFFNSRNWAKTQQLHADMLSFLSQSRKACVDVYFIIQVASTLEKQFRVQSQFEFACRNLNDIRVPLLGAIPIRRMLLVKKDNPDEAGRTVVHSRELVPYRKWLWGCYETLEFLDEMMSEAAKVAQRAQPHKLSRVSPLPDLLRAAAVVFIIATYILIQL